MKNRSLIIQCNNVCPCFCPGCYNFFSDKHVPLNDIIKFISKLGESLRLPKVTLSGGDPLLREGISYFINKLVDQDISVYLDSVGSIFLKDIDEDLLYSLRRISLLGLPLDGTSDDTIQFFRQKMSFEGSMMIIKKSQIVRKSICINTVVHSGNIKEIKDIASIVNDNTHISRWQVFQYMPIGPRGFKNRMKYAIGDKTFHDLVESISKLDFRESLAVDFKSIEEREDKYLILGADGLLWLPQNGPDRVILGGIYDKNIIGSIKRVCNYEKV